MSGVIATYKNPHDAEQAAGRLLESGAEPESISMVVDPGFAEKLVHMDREDAPLYLENDLATTEPGDRTVDLGQTRDKVYYPARDIGTSTDFVETDKPIIHESPIGGGISTATPDDDVSGVEEMDDGQSVAEDLLYPGGPVDRREAELGHDLDDMDDEYVSATDVTDSTRGDKNDSTIKGLGGGTAVGTLAALGYYTVPGIGFALGGGGLAETIGSSEYEAGDLLTMLRAAGVPPVAAAECVEAFEKGGAVVCVEAPSGDASESEIQRALKERASTLRQF